ncbi:hypothetical protein BB561_001192 [Smittium simulii]|uniref:Uncharacterized protein n=1 Tax=Smittium simulii TaxID=133385 RepID=A0A2T9YVR0_9FUNG|nr:hypothetical protein BB561_001192 [Smittium simulii]
MDIQTLFGVKHKIVLVTGGSKGVGLMITKGFVKNGAKVYISSRDTNSLNKISAELTSEGPGSCIPIPANLQSLKDISALVKAIEEKEPGGIDILINNAGATWGAKIDDYPYEGFTKVMNLNLNSVFFLSQKLIPLLEKRGSFEDPSRIINISSIAGLIASDNVFAYNASKAAVNHMSRGMAVALGPRNITVNVIAPGPFPSKMMAETLRKNHDAIVSKIPLKRIGHPNDIVSASIYLSSTAGSYITGTVLVVDGGNHIFPKL